jgi:hypothetical protein
VCDQDSGRTGWTLYSELQVKMSQPCHCRERTGISLELPAAFSFKNFLKCISR